MNPAVLCDLRRAISAVRNGELVAFMGIPNIPADVLMRAEVVIALDGEAKQYLTLFALESSIALDGVADATVTTGACAPFTVLGDSGITVSSGDTISPLADSGETFDACRVLS